MWMKKIVHISFCSPWGPTNPVLGKTHPTDPYSTSSIATGEKLRLTAVGLVAGFAQMVLNKQPLDEACLSKGRNELPTWIADNDRILDSVTPTPAPKSIKDYPVCEKPDDYHTFPDKSSSQTYSKPRSAIARYYIRYIAGSGPSAFFFLRCPLFFLVLRLGIYTETEWKLKVGAGGSIPLYIRICSIYILPFLEKIPFRWVACFRMWTPSDPCGISSRSLIQPPKSQRWTPLLAWPCHMCKYLTICTRIAQKWLTFQNYPEHEWNTRYN